MDTNQAIAILQARVTLLTNNISAQQQELEANQTAISQLQGTLTTQLSKVTDEQVKAFPQVIALITEVSDKATAIEARDTIITDLQSQVAEASKITDPVPVEESIAEKPL